MELEIREPKQPRAILKKDKIIEAGFDLICDKGYYNINTKEIAQKANVSTGILYQYFKDKHDILMAGLNKYGHLIFYPIVDIPSIKLDKENFSKYIKDLLDKYINNHQISHTAHEELMAMVHSDPEVASYYYKREIETTNSIKKYLLENNFKDNNLTEKVHIMLGLIDNLCHEVTFHKHDKMNYQIMTDLINKTIKNLFKNDLN